MEEAYSSSGRGWARISEISHFPTPLISSTSKGRRGSNPPSPLPLHPSPLSRHSRTEEMHATAVTCLRGEEEECDMGKENAPPKRHCHPQLHFPQTAFLTEEQRERIAHNFQEAKALLSQRRPRGLTVLPNNRNVSFEVAETVKTEAPSFPRASLSSLDGSSSLQAPALHRATLNVSSILDEEFDEIVFREIDEICEQRSSRKEERLETGHTNPNELLAVNITGSDCKDSSCSQQRKEERGSSQDCSTCSVPQNYIDYWNNLNDKQREAACSDIFVPLMIVAGPGSGKTSTMVGRVLMLLKEGMQPCNILALTFTTAAASEMRDRVGAAVGKAVAKELAISTFHSFSLQLCRLHADKLGRTADFLVYGHSQQRRAVIEALRLHENKKKVGESSENDSKGIIESLKDKSKKWEKFVIQAKSSGRTPDECRKNGDDMGAAILHNYDEILRSCNALDYHDFISCSVKLTTDFPEVYKECQEKWKAIVVDEFQDTSLMQYSFLKNLASHNCVTVIGDEDQSIFSFNGADISGFEFFRRDFQNYKEVRLVINYRSTRCIVEAASALIRNNTKRCHSKDVVTENSSGSKITLKECHNEDAQCSFVVDKILEITSNMSATKSSFKDVAILYRRQVTGKSFQISFRDRKIPFNIHGVAFYRKKVTKAVISLLKTTLSGCGDGPFRQSFKALLLLDKEEKKKVIDHIEKISTSRECSFLLAANDIFRAKVSGTFKRAQLSQGRKVLATLDMLSKLVERENSISVVISSAAAMIPQKYLLEKRAVVNVDGGKYLNEEHDVRSVLQYLMDDVSEFLSAHVSNGVSEQDNRMEESGCSIALRAFLDYLLTRETENFQNRKHDNENSVTLTTIHQSKGLEWDTVFIVTVNESEIPLLHEFNGIIQEGGATLEEERRLFYVAMTRARKKLYISYVLMDSYWQLQQPSRFLKEIPNHLLDGQGEEVITKRWNDTSLDHSDSISLSVHDALVHEVLLENVNVCRSHVKDAQLFNDDLAALSESCFSNSFLKRFSVEDRSFVSHIFHQWARKSAFQNPKRLLGKIGYVIDERLRNKNCKNKDLLRALKLTLDDNEASQYAQQILKWEKIPFEKRSHLMREKQEHFQKQRMMKSMGTSDATSKQIVYLQMLGCTVVPTSRLHASNLIEQYKTL